MTAEIPLTTTTFPTLPRTMRAAVTRRYGPPEEVVTIERVPVPAVGPNQVLIRVGAASINALDWHYVTGTPMFARISLGLRRPDRLTPGADVAGTVAAIGDGVVGLAPGDRVCAEVDGGGFAEYVLARRGHVIPAPERLDDAEAATLGVAALTALQGLRDWGGLRAGQRVLINGASGGVGSFAVQIATALGAGHVTAVCSTQNLETARSSGADRVIDYTVEDATDIGERFDVLFDNAGTWPLSACRRLLGPGGRYVSVTAPKSRWIKPLPRMIAAAAYFAATRTSAAIGKVATQSAADLTLLAAMVDDGRLTPVMDRRWSLDDAAEALRVQGEFHARGKSVVIP